MKKSFMKFAAMFAAVAFIFAACEKDNGDNSGNGGLKDPEQEQPGNNNQGNGDNNGGGNTSELHASLQGSSYVPISLDEYSTAAIQNKIKASYQLDDTNVFLYVWENTYAAGTPSGLNFYGEAAGWSSLVVGSVGWSGCGWCVVNPETVPAFVDSSADLADWKFHIAYKGQQGKAHIVILYWNGQEYKFAIGEGSLEDAGVSYTAVAPTSGKFQANVWNEYEISLAETGMDYTQTTTGNIAAVLSGGVAGTTLDVDAIFFYKK